MRDTQRLAVLVAQCDSLENQEALMRVAKMIVLWPDVVNELRMISHSRKEFRFLFGNLEAAVANFKVVVWQVQQTHENLREVDLGIGKVAQAMREVKESIAAIEEHLK